MLTEETSEFNLCFLLNTIKMILPMPKAVRLNGWHAYKNIWAQKHLLIKMRGVDSPFKTRALYAWWPWAAAALVQVIKNFGNSRNFLQWILKFFNAQYFVTELAVKICRYFACCISPCFSQLQTVYPYKTTFVSFLQPLPINLFCVRLQATERCASMLVLYVLVWFQQQHGRLSPQVWASLTWWL